MPPKRVFLAPPGSLLTLMEQHAWLATRAHFLLPVLPLAQIARRAVTAFRRLHRVLSAQ